MKIAGMILTSAAVAMMTLTPVAASAQTVAAQVGQWCAETATRTDAPGQNWHQTFCTGRDVVVVDDVDAVVVDNRWVPVAALLGAAAVVAAIVLLAGDDDDDDDIPVSP
ncbi:hypothetical protein [Allosphingosinicella sp.]|uniref:hypothetical protein n=1 Tax=Allosphingosinicella sp. TaxID=2823234 RepID=UPI002FC1846F